MNNLLKIVLLILISLILYLNVGNILKKTGIYEFQYKNFVSYSSNEHHHDEDEGSMAYFESEFEQQPYRLPYDSSLKMLKLSILLIFISFILREFYIKKYG
ncbi:MAG: hypothetical protein ACP5RD_02590 [bacterium]